MKQLDVKQMEEILFAHELAELENDVEATMATLGPNPHYEIATLGLAVDGTDAVRETYKRILPGAQKWDIAAEKRGSYAIAPNTLIREAYVSFNTREGKRVTGLYLVVMAFDAESELIIGERMYTDPLWGKRLAEDLGDDFKDLPGVSPVSDSAPLIGTHDAFAEAAARGVAIEHPTQG